MSHLVAALFGAMPDLSVFQYNIVDNIFSMTVATMGAAALFLFMSLFNDRESRLRFADLLYCSSQEYSNG